MAGVNPDKSRQQHRVDCVFKNSGRWCNRSSPRPSRSVSSFSCLTAGPPFCFPSLAIRLSPHPRLPAWPPATAARRVFPAPAGRPGARPPPLPWSPGRPPVAAFGYGGAIHYGKTRRRVPAGPAGILPRTWPGVPGTARPKRRAAAVSRRVPAPPPRPGNNRRLKDRVKPGPAGQTPAPTSGIPRKAQKGRRI